MALRKDTKARDFTRVEKMAIAERDSIDGWTCCVFCGAPAPRPSGMEQRPLHIPGAGRAWHCPEWAYPLPQMPQPVRPDHGENGNEGVFPGVPDEHLSRLE